MEMVGWTQLMFQSQLIRKGLIMDHYKYFRGKMCFLFVFLISFTSVAKEDTLSGPKYNIVDRFGVNVGSGQVQPLQTVLKIGGDASLEYTVSSYTSDFFNWGGLGGGSQSVLGFRDHYRGGMIDKILYQSGSTVNNNWQFGVRLFGLGHNVDFAQRPNGDFIPYEYPSGYSLQFETSSAFTGYIMTTPDGTRLYYPGNKITTTLNINSTVYKTLSKVVYPTGYTIEIGTHPQWMINYSVKANNGFQFKYNYNGSWTQWAPRSVTAINNRYVNCPTSNTSCSLANDWPKAEFYWTQGNPSESNKNSILGNTAFAVKDAKGVITQYRHKTYQSSVGPAHPRLYQILRDGDVIRNYDYEFDTSTTPNGGLLFITQTVGMGKVKSASEPGGGAATYSMQIPKQGSVFLGYVNYGSAGIGQIQSVDYDPYSALQQIVTWDDVISYSHGRGNPLYSDTKQLTTKISSQTVKKGGLSVFYDFDSRGNILSKTVNGISRTASFPASCTSSNFKYCNKPEWIENGNGNKTYFTYHSGSGQIESRTSPENSAGVKPKTVYTYTQKYAHYKKNSNTIQASDTPIWLKSSEKYCQTSAMSSSNTCSANDLVTITYEYDYYNLYLTSVIVTAKNHQGVFETRRTCYEYDKLGNKIGEVSPNANLSTCN